MENFDQTHHPEFHGHTLFLRSSTGARRKSKKIRQNLSFPVNTDYESVNRFSLECLEAEL